ncbi:hypothetical protein Tsubulata_011786 [Turnera subulata]|uniref:TRF2/HOY1 PH-like domain-containing protein n=1 Tax=Turnera subulata TaxID=218843 RepID=A0A9Q0JM38_9ROSI|nr:hypothetical protein Tsubulata_011786 [Turnera subulata]
MGIDPGCLSSNFVFDGGSVDRGGGGGYGGDKYLVSSNNNNNFAHDGYIPPSQSIDAANQRIMQTPKANNDQAKLDNELLKLRPIGLKLDVLSVQSILMSNKLSRTKNYDAQIGHRPSTSQAKANNFVSQPISEKLKASNFPASYIRIGSWEIVSKNEGDLVAKCYFAKKKLVWELLKGGLKSKIEIQWSDIIGLKATFRDNEPGILQLELNNPPTFHEEVDPQPRKHTIWKITSDFTEGQATSYRIHYLRFPPGSLDKHYEKLLQCEPRLLKLSQRHFPCLSTPFFQHNSFGHRDLGFEYSGHRPQINFGRANAALQSIPAPLVSAQPFHYYARASQPYVKETPSPISVMEFLPLDEQMSNQVLENPTSTHWGPNFNNYANSYPRPPLQGLIPVVPSNQGSPMLFNTANNYRRNDVQGQGFMSPVLSNSPGYYARGPGSCLAPIPAQGRPVLSNSVDSCRGNQVQELLAVVPSAQVNQVVLNNASGGYDTNQGVLTAVPLTQVSYDQGLSSHQLLDEGPKKKLCMTKVASLSQLLDLSNYENSANLSTQQHTSNGDDGFVFPEHANPNLSEFCPSQVGGMPPPQHPMINQQWNDSSCGAVNNSDAVIMQEFGQVNSFNEGHHWNRDRMGWYS